ncbi:MAG: hypothetical protein Kow006_21880 [Gammaproteobacteria bacterium]
MKIFLIGNYESLRQPSMQRFAEMLRDGLIAAGHEVRLALPPVVLGRMFPGNGGLAKWIGYIDRFLLYPLLLRRQVRWADIIHICDQANAVYIPHLRGKPHVLTCHDVLAIRAALGEIPQAPTRWSGRVYQRWILRNLRRAERVVCVSRHTEEEVRRLADLDGDRVQTVPNALNYPYWPMPAEEAKARVQSLGIKPPFCLHVGGNEWYKNRAGVLQIFAALVQKPGYQHHRLAVAGKRLTTALRQSADNLGVRGRIVECGSVCGEDLRALYSTADVLIFPSLAEGFGWPIIEAQACGCPVATSNRPPMTEVGGSAAIYIDPESPKEAAALIARGLGERERLRAKGLENDARYSRQAMIEGYLEAYRKAIREQQSSVSGCAARKESL